MANPYAPKVKKAVEVPVEAVEDVTPEEEAEELPEDVTTSKETLQWVGEDKSRAELVQAQEEASETPRKTLLKGLEKVLNG